MVMNLSPHEFMATMEKRVSFTDKDKALLKSQATWGQQITSELAVHFSAYLGRAPEMNAILNETQGRIHRLH